MTGYIALGSNLGDRGRYLRAGLSGLAATGLRPTRVSSVWETEPVGLPDGGWFWNMAVEITTTEPPHRVLERSLIIERDAGRQRNARNRSRTLDVDLLMLGDLSVADERLRLPHPRMWERSFVLAPLAEIAPDLRNPANGRTVTDELARIDRPTRIRSLGTLDWCPTVLL
ncbi:MAG: 2-amino-4-hydroxy-6-hydroxymethyldihydropteridine diphosphokinase [Acidobacteria bacterium]|nr:2-amino-4-hydroxy-6-hydroxymethyldihydropteridine diphosphokinase [Acidobacteriota bacterium]NIM63328.1 2-amino-4-hydroxy-6-hydroxymethyldihydropteridine diphosphokinase [Acidobacteriota bacterium]NIO60512.1 2-amino-4-hydroxy-6-hydroxymethyldihydropteridine diphosphokinase [Acidobacteriota bacterium]NIQ31632.1 2-amino-4-hydroxy-6-hydroxymethyldihydropteridine diphosphokinase [Acidobacteriota bacterium]NIQ87119.1 2-amino-4-hydroxy-6-hydroxymethyldihydropteridine diphosphokinase [Acidobacterio